LASPPCRAGSAADAHEGTDTSRGAHRGSTGRRIGRTASMHRAGYGYFVFLRILVIYACGWTPLAAPASAASGTIGHHHPLPFCAGGGAAGLHPHEVACAGICCEDVLGAADEEEEEGHGGVVPRVAKGLHSGHGHRDGPDGEAGCTAARVTCLSCSPAIANPRSAVDGTSEARLGSTSNNVTPGLSPDTLRRYYSRSSRGLHGNPVPRSRGDGISRSCDAPQLHHGPPAGHAGEAARSPARREDHRRGRREEGGGSTGLRRDDHRGGWNGGNKEDQDPTTKRPTTHTTTGREGPEGGGEGTTRTGPSHEYGYHRTDGGVVEEASGSVMQRCGGRNERNNGRLGRHLNHPITDHRRQHRPASGPGGPPATDCVPTIHVEGRLGRAGVGCTTGHHRRRFQCSRPRNIVRPNQPTGFHPTRRHNARVCQTGREEAAAGKRHAAASRPVRCSRSASPCIRQARSAGGARVPPVTIGAHGNGARGGGWEQKDGTLDYAFRQCFPEASF
jgi:hypothetical protein